MTRIGRYPIRCALCGKKSKQGIIISTNSFGSKDLDFRPPGMLRRTMYHWVQECLHCGYVNDKIKEKLPIEANRVFEIMEMMDIDPGLKAFNSDNILANRFYKQYLNYYSIYESFLGNQECYVWLLRTFHAILHAAWACDDEGEESAATMCRKKAINLLDEYQKALLEEKVDLSEEEINLETLLVIKADLMRRAGLFERIESEYTDIRLLSDPFLQGVIKFHLQKAAADDRGCYTFSHVDGEIDF